MISPHDMVIGLWGLLGGIIRLLSIAVTGGYVPSLSHIVANIMIAGFCGTLASKAVGAFDHEWIIVGAGVGGYLGTQAIEMIMSINITSEHNKRHIKPKRRR